jgi:hypothetical protein
MAGYDHYVDSNGVRWHVVTPAKDHGWSLMADVDPEQANPYYVPDVDIQTASMEQGGLQLGPLDIVKSPPPTSQQQQTLFLELRDKIETYAREHRANVVLRVTASKGMPWWVWGLIVVGVALASEES